MNKIFSIIWSQAANAWVVVSEHSARQGKSGRTRLNLVVGALGAAPLSLLAADLPQGGQVTLGSGAISTPSSNHMQIQQGSQKLAIDWQSFDIGADSKVTFQQPGSDAIALNRVVGSDGSKIMGQLDANGRVFLINPNGVLIGKGAQVNVGGLVASTLELSNEDFAAGNYRFKGDGSNASVVNQGSIKAADGGAVALLGGKVSNEGVIAAKMGTVALAAGNQVTLDFAGDGLLNVQIDEATKDALVENHQLIQADGGQVLMTAKASDALLKSVVNNTGVIEAQTLGEKNGKIALLGGFDGGTVEVAGTLDASAPNGGNGGFIDTSGAHVQVKEGAQVTTQAAKGKTGTWLIPPSHKPAAAGGGYITGAQLSSNLNATNVTLQSSSGAKAGSGDININDAVSWSQNTLTLNAARNININAVMTASGTSALALNTATANGADAAVAGGVVNVGLSGSGFYGRVDFPNRSGTGFLTINGNGYTVIKDLGAEGSTTGTDLQGINGNRTGYFALGGDIDASATSGWSSGFAPLGTYSYTYSDRFSGKFDGLGHTVSNLTIRRPGTTEVGLFGATGSGVALSNIGVVNANVNGQQSAGILVGGLDAANGTIRNAYTSGFVSTWQAFAGGLAGSNTGTIVNSYSTAEVGGTGNNGGLVAFNDGLISNSYASGTVSASGLGVDGLVGGLVANNNSGTISNSYSTATVSTAGFVYYAGGLVGSNNAAITNSWASGLVTGSLQPGGLVGGALGGSTVTGSFWDTQTTGQSSSAGGVGLTTAQLKTLGTFTGAGWSISDAGGDGSVWRIYGGDSYPLLRSFLRPLAFTAVAADTRTYSGTAYSGGNGYTAPGADPAKVLYGGSAQGAVNAGSYTITAYSNQQGYDFIGGTRSASLTINPAALSVTASPVSKTYDRLSYSGGNVTYSGFVNGETASVLGGTLAYGGSSQGAINAGSYVITPSGLSSGNYAISYVNGALTINPALLTLGGISAANKVYDGTTTAMLNTSGVTFSGLLGGDLVTLSGTGSGAFADKNVGNGKAVTVSGYTLLGADAGNYLLAQPSGLTANITPAAVTLGGIRALNKLYDGMTRTVIDATGMAVNGLLGGDSVTLGGLGRADFLDKNAGAGKAVTISGYALSGTDAGNYVLRPVSGVTASITPATLTIGGITASNKVYDGTTAATVNTAGATFTGLVAGDNVTVNATGSFADKNVGNGKAVSLRSTYGGADVGNYFIFVQPSTTANITPKALTLTGITASNKVYDGTTVASLNVAGFSFIGLVGSDTVSLGGAGIGSFADKNVGTGKTVTVSGYTLGVIDGSNYSLLQPTGLTADITPAAVTLGGIKALHKVYDGATRTLMDFTGMTVNGLLVGDSVTLGGLGRGDFVDKNVGDGKAVTVSGYALSGTDAGNYLLRPVSGVTASITPAALTVSGISAANKMYDGTTAATANTAGASFAGLVAGDQLSVSATGSFADKNVGSGKTVILRNTYGGADAGNYRITDQANTTANISPASLNIAGITASDKEYDGTTAATVNTAGATFLGLAAGDSVTVNATGSFADKNAGSGKTVSLRSTYSGADVGNYFIFVQPSTMASITPKALTLAGITAANKVYDGTRVAALNTAGLTFSGLLAGDSVTLGGSGTGSFADKNVGDGKTVTVSGYTLGGNDAANYSVGQPSGLMANITPKALTVSGLTANNKVYDGTTAATANTAGASFAGRVAGDQVGVSATGTFSDKNAGSGKRVNLRSTYSGADLGNYTITDQTSSTADITPRSVTVTANGGRSSYGDTGLSNPGLSATGLVNGESLAVLSGLSNSFGIDATTAAGRYLLSVQGTLGNGNYVVSQRNDGTWVVEPKAVVIDPKPDMALTKRNLLLDEAYRGALASAHSSSWPTSFSQANGLDNNGSLYIVENSGIRLPEGGAVLPAPITCDPHAAGQSAGCPSY